MATRKRLILKDMKKRSFLVGSIDGLGGNGKTKEEEEEEEEEDERKKRKQKTRKSTKMSKSVNKSSLCGRFNELQDFGHQ